jgi:mannan endo-1,4-beta-mannosidase
MTACTTCPFGLLDGDERLPGPCLEGAAALGPAQPAPSPVPTSFVTRDRDRLLVDGQTFRIVGTNIYWLGLDEWYGVHPPSTFRQDDALIAAWQLGATVVRAHSLGISVGNSLSFEPTLGQFNHAALAAGDRAIALAGQLGIRLIIPLTDNYHYFTGGRFTFTRWHGRDDFYHGDDFFKDPSVISDFEVYINQLLNHVNTQTGIAYKDDPTILAWELGNELDPDDKSLYVAWSSAIARFIKVVDPRHLVADAFSFVKHDAGGLAIPEIDLYTTHFYNCTADPDVVTRAAAPVSAAGKVFYVGEYDWTQDSPEHLRRLLTMIEHDPRISGDLYWSLWGHADDFGYVSSDIYSLHSPGDDGGRQQRVGALRAHAFTLRGAPVPTWAPPPAPTMLTVTPGAAGVELRWRGSAGAAAYTIETAADVNGPWSVVCDACMHDQDLPFATSALSALVRVTPVACDRTLGVASAEVAVPQP